MAGNNGQSQVWLDRQDRIVAIGGAWDQFALDNGGEDLLARHLEGKLIWDYTTGYITHRWLAGIFAHVRLTGEALEAPYRCDSPELKRYMKMRITAEDAGHLGIRHELLAVEPRERPIHFLFAPLHAIGALLKRCSNCGHLSQGDVWEEPHPSHGDALNGIPIIYAICDNCWTLCPVE